MKLTNEHFELFKKECQARIEQFGLKSWNVYYRFKPLKNKFGNCGWDYSGRVAAIACSTDFSMESGVTIEEEIKRTALHECLELLLSPLDDLAKRRDWNSADFDKEVHTVIRTLEKIL